MDACTQSVHCQKCNSPIYTEATPDGIYAACKGCAKGTDVPQDRCPICGGEALLIQVERDWADPTQSSYEACYECHECRIEVYTKGSPLWPAQMLRDARFHLELDRYATSHPEANLAALSRFLCSEIEKTSNSGHESDPCLLMLNLSERTGAIMRPWGDGWRLERGELRVLLGPGCRVDFARETPDRNWIVAESGVEVEDLDIIERVLDWLRNE